MLMQTKYIIQSQEVFVPVRGDILPPPVTLLLPLLLGLTAPVNSLTTVLRL